MSRIGRKKYILVFFCILLCITGCQRNIVETDAMEISVKNLDNNQVYKITDEDEICRITDNINSSEKEFCIFKPDMELELAYCDGKKKTVLIKKNRLKMDGVSYINNSIKEYIPSKTNYGD